MAVRGRVVEWRRILGAAKDHALPDGGHASLCGLRSVSWVPNLSGDRCSDCVGILSGAKGQPAGRWAPLPEERWEILDALHHAGPAGLRIAFHRPGDREWLAKSGYARRAGDPPRWRITARGMRAHDHYRK